MKKSNIIALSIVLFTSILSIRMYGKNKKLNGIILNQENTISGLLGELKKTSYHLGRIKNKH